MEPQTETYLRTDIRNILRAMLLASAAIDASSYRAGYQDALRAIALAFDVRLDDDWLQSITYKPDADIDGESW